MVLDSLSVSTSVVTGAPVHVLRVVLDGLHLLLTPTAGEGSVSSAHSVCVLDVEWLEINLRLCDNQLMDNDTFQKVLLKAILTWGYDNVMCVCQLFSKLPDVSVECTSNILHLRMCADSCIALCDLLLYMSSQQDLVEPVLPAAMDYSSLLTSIPKEASGPPVSHTHLCCMAWFMCFCAESV